MLRSPSVLLLSTDNMETALFQELLNEHAILTLAGNLSEMAELLKFNSYDAVFCARSFQRGTWNDAVRNIQESHPGLPVIVLSSAPEKAEWAEVLEAGAFDLLVPPYDERAVLAVLEQATSSREALATWHRGSLLQARA